MSSDQPQQPPTPFYRTYPTFANHINDLLHGPHFVNQDPSSCSPAMSSPDPARSTVSASGRPLPTLAEADERRRRLIAGMVAQYPRELLVTPETRTSNSPPAEGLEGLSGFAKELDAIVAARHEKTQRYEEFHVEWTDLQNQLQKKSEELRAKYADLIEQVQSVHHKYKRDRIKKDEYISARKALAEQMDDVFEKLGKFAFTMGTMYAESRAVAQGANPTGDFDFGKLNISACNAVPFLTHHFPEFVKKKTSSIPPDPMSPRPSEVAFKQDLPAYDFIDMMATVWRKHPTKLHEIHHAVFEATFAGIKELTQKEKNNANALLGYGGEWSI